MSCSVLRDTSFTITDKILAPLRPIDVIDPGMRIGRRTEHQMNCGLRKRRVRDQVDLGHTPHRPFWHTLNIVGFIVVCWFLTSYIVFAIFHTSNIFFEQRSASWLLAKDVSQTICHLCHAPSSAEHDSMLLKKYMEAL